MPLLHVAKRAFSVASCLLSVADSILACRLLQIDTAPSHTQRIAAAHRN
jgi:hypothetical protein